MPASGTLTLGAKASTYGLPSVHFGGSILSVTSTEICGVFGSVRKRICCDTVRGKLTSSHTGQGTTSSEEYKVAIGIQRRQGVTFGVCLFRDTGGIRVRKTFMGEVAFEKMGAAV